MYKHILKEKGQIFEEAVTLPKTSAHVCANGLNVGNQLGMLACTLTAKTTVAIAAGKKVTVTFQHADSEGGPYAEYGACTVTTADALSVGPGGVVARCLLPPDSKKWIKAALACDDTAASGSLDIFIEYLAR
jgi:hypothetical protein